MAVASLQGEHSRAALLSGSSGRAPTNQKVPRFSYLDSQQTSDRMPTLGRDPDDWTPMCPDVSQTRAHPPAGARADHARTSSAKDKAKHQATLHNTPRKQGPGDLQELGVRTKAADPETGHGQTLATVIPPARSTSTPDHLGSDEFDDSPFTVPTLYPDHSFQWPRTRCEAIQSRARDGPARTGLCRSHHHDDEQRGEVGE